MNNNEALTDKYSAEDDLFLDEILQPLIDLLNERFRDRWEGEFVATDDGPFYVTGDGYSVTIKLPDGPEQYPIMALGLAALLQRTGSYQRWQETAVETDLCRTPLRFSIVKKTLWRPDLEYFHTGSSLLVEGWDFSTAAVLRQVELLVEFLGEPANLLNASAKIVVRDL